MSLHALLLLRASWHEAHLSVGSSCFSDRRHSAAQLIVAVSVENNVASFVFHVRLCCVVTRPRLVCWSCILEKYLVDIAVVL